MRMIYRLIVLIVSSFSAVASPAVYNPNTSQAHFYILQVNDTYKIEGLEHGARGGFARLRTLRKTLEKEGRVLLLHGGDILYPSVMSKYLQAEPIIKIMNLLDGDAAAFDANFIATYGNHEFDNPEPSIVLKRTAESGFSWVATNLRFRENKDDPGEPLARRSWNIHERMIYEVNGLKLGVFGLTLDTQPQDYIAYDYAPDIRRALVRKTIDELRRDGAQMMIAVTHESLEQDEWLAREFPEIALIAGGHEHFHIQKQVGQTWITKADSDSQSAVVYDIALAEGQPLITAPRKIMLDGSIPEDPEIKQAVNAYIKQLSAALKAKTGHDGTQVYGWTKNLLEGEETAVRRRETALGNFLTDTMRSRMGADIAFVNGGGIRINDNIPPGPITGYDLEGIFYFDNALVSFELTGGELLDILRNSIANVHVGDGRFLQVSGIRFKYHKRGTGEAPCYEINERDVEILAAGSDRYKPLDSKRIYKAATTDFIWEWGYRDGYALFQKGRGGASPARLDGGEKIGFRAAVEEALARLPSRTVTTVTEGRIESMGD